MCKQYYTPLYHAAAPVVWWITGVENMRKTMRSKDWTMLRHWIHGFSNDWFAIIRESVGWCWSMTVKNPVGNKNSGSNKIEQAMRYSNQILKSLSNLQSDDVSLFKSLSNLWPFITQRVLDLWTYLRLQISIILAIEEGLNVKIRPRFIYYSPPRY